MSHVKVSKIGDVVVLAPRGQLVGGDETTELEQMLKDLAVEENKKLIIDLGEVDFINSWALGVLIGGHVNYAKREGHIKLANMSQRIDQLLVITKLVRIFEMYETVEEASKGFPDS
jgi:anti-sigma B factor antagonist